MMQPAPCDTAQTPQFFKSQTVSCRGLLRKDLEFPSGRHVSLDVNIDSLHAEDGGSGRRIVGGGLYRSVRSFS